MDYLEKMEEFNKCSVDAVYFIKKYCYIDGFDKGFIPLDLYSFQEDLILEYEQNDFNIVLKARQLGITTITIAYILHEVMFNSNVKVLFVAPNQGMVDCIVDKLRIMIRIIQGKYPSWLPEKFEDGRDFIFYYGSSIKIISDIGAMGVMDEEEKKKDLIVFDEFAFQNKNWELWKKYKLLLEEDGKVIIYSTANPDKESLSGFFFQKLYQNDGEQGEYNFKPTKLIWDVHPEKDQKWFDNMVSFGMSCVDQEYLCKWSNA